METAHNNSSGNTSGGQPSAGINTGVGGSIALSFHSTLSGGMTLVSQPGPQGYILVNNQTNSMAGATVNTALCLLEFSGKADSDTK